MEQTRKDALERLIRLPEKHSGDFEYTAKIATQIACEQLGADTASVWLLSEDQQQLHLVYRHQSIGQPIEVDVMDATAFPEYFQHIFQHRVLCANDVHIHPATKALTTDYSAPYGICSMLDAGIRINGHLEGVICVESLQPKLWNQDDADWLGMLADQLTLAKASRNQNKQAVQLDLFRHAMDQSNQRMAMIDAETLKIRYINQAYLRLAGGCIEDYIDKPSRNMLLFRQNPEQGRKALKEVTDFGYTRGEAKVVSPSGEVCWIEYRVNQFIVEGGKRYFILYSDDITAERNHKAELEWLAWRCGLTGLFNRAYFSKELERSPPKAFILCDLNNFKTFNDLHGHDVGDQILKETARRLRHCAESFGASSVARIGSDEFVMQFEQAPERDLMSIAEQVKERLNLPIQINARSFEQNISLALLERDELAEQVDVMQALDLAMAKAKRTGQIEFFDRELREDFCGRILLQQDLRLALARKEFELYYQPLVSLKTGEVLGAEALLRWRHPKDGLLTPYHFIDVAEESGIIEQIGSWVLETASYQLHLWQRSRPNFQMHVNVSAKQLLGNDLFDVCWKQLNHYPLTANTLVLEITETSLMEEINLVSRFCDHLGELGVILAIDDFGTGYSSMRYLQRLPVDKLKIDRSFIKDLEESREDREIVPAIIAMGQALDLVITAEGVETEGQKAFLQQWHCDTAQGYLFGRPVDVHSFEQAHFTVQAEQEAKTEQQV